MMHETLSALSKIHELLAPKTKEREKVMNGSDAVLFVIAGGLCRVKDCQRPALRVVVDLTGDHLPVCIPHLKAFAVFDARQENATLEQLNKEADDQERLVNAENLATLQKTDLKRILITDKALKN